MIREILLSILFLIVIINAGESVFVPMELEKDLPASLEIDAEKGNESFHLIMEQEKRSEEFEFRVQNADGELVVTEPPQMRSYRGYAVEDPSQRVVATVKVGGVEVYFLDTPPERTFDIGDGEYELDFAFDVDNKFFELCGKDIDSCMMRIDRGMAIMQEVYERDLKTRYNITFIILRADPTKCPYETHVPGLSSPFDMYNHLKEFWPQDFEAVDNYDLAHIITGRGAGSGVASRGSICNNGAKYAASSYGVGTDYDFYKIMRHEVGHSWGANDHYGPGPMGQTIMWGNDYDYFCDEVLKTEMMAIRERECITKLSTPIGNPKTISLDDYLSNVKVSFKANSLILNLKGQQVSAAIFDARGKLVRRFFERDIVSNEVILNMNKNGKKLSEGEYILKIDLDGRQYTKKLLQCD